MEDTSPTALRPNKSAPFDRYSLIRERAKAGLNQKELAEKSGISKTHISRIELGGCGVSPDALRRLADAIGCDTEDLMTAERS